MENEEMATLVSVKKSLTIFGVIPVLEQDFPPKLRDHQSFINCTHITLIMICLVTKSSAVLLFLFFEATEFLEFAEAGFFSAVTILHVASYTLLIRSRSKLLALIKQSEITVEKRSMKPVLRTIYSQANEESTELMKSLFKIGFVFAEIFLFPNAARSFYLYFFSNLGADSFELMMKPTMIPWNWKTPTGFLIVVCVQYAWVHCGIFLVICTLPLFGGFCSLFGAFTLDIKKTLEDMEDSVNFAGHKFSEEKRIELYSKLSEISWLYSHARELIDRFSKTYSALITLVFAISSTLFCTALLGMNAAPTFTDVMRFFVCLAVMMTYLVKLCFLSDEVTFKFGLVSQFISECSWYKLPLEVQKILPSVLMNVQRPVYIKGHMNVRCTRESVKLIINAAVSYFMVLREFNN